ncbi:ribosomal protein S18-alanine N-acetyltransferase [Gammaproteobacteria bacterium]|nr:ribosomal protein S18-alanine N-acetyltransferase [Gammaproteobacteria bacterium]
MNDSTTDFEFANQDDVENIIKIMRNGYYKCWDREFFLDLIKNRNSLLCVLRKEKSIIGFIAGKKSEENCDIIMLIIDIKNRGEGFGSLLLSNTLLVLKDMRVKNIYLEVAVNNSSAISLYEKYGFKKINIRKSYYKFNKTMIDAVLYRMVNS